MPNGKNIRERSQKSEGPPFKLPLPQESHVIAESLVNQNQVHNIGLFFNKFVCIWDDNWTLDNKVGEGKRQKSVKSYFLEQVQGVAGRFHLDRSAYDAFLDRQLKLSESFRDNGYQTAVFGKRANARILSGLGGAHPMEVGFSFHPLYGFPYLPGSGLKGVARAWAELTAQDPDKIKSVFGSESKDERQSREHQQGGVIFFDAYAVTPPKLEVDILNPHFPDYYRDPKNNLPTEWQSPNPVNFLTIGTGKEEKDKPIFQLILVARSSEALHLAQDWLERGLEQLGFGGKTASGYGYFSEGRLGAQDLDKIRDEIGRAEPPKAPAPQPSLAEKTILKRQVITPTPTTVAPKVTPPKAPKAVTTPTIRQGDKLEAEVMANDGRKVTIRLIGVLKQEVTFEHTYYPHQQGKKVKVKVMSVNSEGKVTRVSPA